MKFPFDYQAHSRRRSGKGRALKPGRLLHIRGRAAGAAAPALPTPAAGGQTAERGWGRAAAAAAAAAGMPPRRVRAAAVGRKDTADGGATPVARVPPRTAAAAATAAAATRAAG